MNHEQLPLEQYVIMSTQRRRCSFHVTSAVIRLDEGEERTAPLFSRILDEITIFLTLIRARARARASLRKLRVPYRTPSNNGANPGREKALG